LYIADLAAGPVKRKLLLKLHARREDDFTESAPCALLPSVRNAARVRSPPCKDLRKERANGCIRELGSGS